VTEAPSSAGWGVGASWALRATGGICVILALVYGAAASSGASIRLGAGSLREAGPYQLGYASGTCLYTLGLICTVPLFLVWLYRARSRQRWFAGAMPTPLQSLAARDISPARAVVVWFIPFANLFLPFMTMEELFRDEGERDSNRPTHLPVWWGTFVGSNVIGAVILPLGHRLSGDPELLGNSVWLGCVREVLLAISAFLAAGFIEEFERRTALRAREATLMAIF
jgi:hypothetical protein